MICSIPDNKYENKARVIHFERAEGSNIDSGTGESFFCQLPDLKKACVCV